MTGGWVTTVRRHNHLEKVCPPSIQNAIPFPSLAGLCCGPHVVTGSNSFSQDKTTAILENGWKDVVAQEGKMSFAGSFGMFGSTVFHWPFRRNSAGEDRQKPPAICLFSVLKVFWIACQQPCWLTAISWMMTQRCLSSYCDSLISSLAFLPRFGCALYCLCLSGTRTTFKLTLKSLLAYACLLAVPLFLVLFVTATNTPAY